MIKSRRSLLPLFAAFVCLALLSRDVMFYYRVDELFAVRKGTYKAHLKTAQGYADPGKQLKFEPHAPPLLFELGSDPGERFNVATNHQDVLADIQREIEKHRAGLVPGKPQ